MKPKTAINPKKVLKSFPHAIRGMMLVFNERNMQVHVLAVFAVITLGTFGYQLATLSG
jgi:diacylglycerol kinase